MVSKFSQVRVIEGQFVPWVSKLVRVIGSFEKWRVPEMGVEIIELEWSKSKGNKVWFEISGGSGNRGFEKSGFHCNYVLNANSCHLGSTILDFWISQRLQESPEIKEKVIQTNKETLIWAKNTKFFSWHLHKYSKKLFRFKVAAGKIRPPPPPASPV